MYSFPVTAYTYRKDESIGDLKLYVSEGDSRSGQQARPAIVFFHGAGFSNNRVTPAQFQHHACECASWGFVSICAEYRPSHTEGLFSPIQSIAHAKSAIRWIRSHADELGVDPTRIAAAGASAGGYLCLCCAMVEGFEESDADRCTNSRPDAIVLFNGGVDSELLVRLFPDLAEDLRKASPTAYMQEGLPPSLFFHGTADANIPISAIAPFVEQMKSYANVSRLSAFEGMGHGFFNYGNHGNLPYERTMEEMRTFFMDIGFL